jgi:high frequency lysogenization protein
MVTRQQTLSLAAVVQCCILVQRMARTGSVDENNLSRMVRTAVIVETPDPESLYDGTTDISPALKLMGTLATGKPDAEQLDVLRMSNSALQLQATLRGNDLIRNKLGSTLATLNAGSRSIPYTDEVFFSLNDAYTETLSHLRPSIIVNGAEGHLQSAVLVAKVRSALLAAVRNAYLWHQLGGRRWHLLVFRKRYGEHVRELLGHPA